MMKSGLLSAISPRRIVVSMLLCSAPALAGDYTTLTINSVPFTGPVVLTNSIIVESNQVAQIVAWPLSATTGSYFIDVEKQGITYTFNGNIWASFDWREITPVAGPVTIRLRGRTNDVNNPQTTFPPVNVYCTVRVTPEAFSPEKTVVVVPGSGGANVSLECSTNLTEWSAATNGIYGSLNTARFFRINLNRAGFVPPVPPDGSIASQADAQTTTLFVRGVNRQEDEVSINDYQTAEIVAVGARNASLLLWRGLQQFTISFNSDGTPRSWKDCTPVRGPAKFRLVGEDGYCTIRVFTEQYPPDKTLITLPGTNTYAVTLEGSTNLVQWSTATNGTYTVPQAMFFRIRSDLVTPP